MYRPSGWESGLDVTARLYDVATLAVIDGAITFDEMDSEPIYYADVEFPDTGKYLLVILHSGQRRASVVLKAGYGPGIVYRV